MAGDAARRPAGGRGRRRCGARLPVLGRARDDRLVLGVGGPRRARVRPARAGLRARAARVGEPGASPRARPLRRKPLLSSSLAGAALVLGALAIAGPWQAERDVEQAGAVFAQRPFGPTRAWTAPPTSIPSATAPALIEGSIALALRRPGAGARGVRAGAGPQPARAVRHAGARGDRLGPGRPRPSARRCCDGRSRLRHATAPRRRRSRSSASGRGGGHRGPQPPHPERRPTHHEWVRSAHRIEVSWTDGQMLIRPPCRGDTFKARLSRRVMTARSPLIALLFSAAASAPRAAPRTRCSAATPVPAAASRSCSAAARWAAAVAPLEAAARRPRAARRACVPRAPRARARQVRRASSPSTPQKRKSSSSAASQPKTMTGATTTSTTTAHARRRRAAGRCLPDQRG